MEVRCCCALILQSFIMNCCCIRHLPFYNLTKNLAETFSSDAQILLSDFDVWNFQPSPRIRTEKSEIPGEISPARFSVRPKKGRGVTNLITVGGEGRTATRDTAVDSGFVWDQQPKPRML